jgi:hypothetical protein
MFVKSILTLHKSRSSEFGSLIFNKDDDLIMDFLTSATNIRAFNFSIPMEVLTLFFLFYITYFRVNSS